MRLTRTTILAGGAALLVAGTAAAAADKLHTMHVALPDGSVAQIEYSGDIAPKVTVEPVDVRTVAFDPFAELDRMAAYVEAQHRVMMQQVQAMQQAAMKAGTAEPGQLTVVGGLPAGTHFSYVSSTTDANGCTQTVQYTSDGSSAQPKVTRTSAGNCDKATSDAPVAASATRQAEPEGPGLRT